MPITEAGKRAHNKWRRKPKVREKENLRWRVWCAENLERRREIARESARRRRALKVNNSKEYENKNN